ncbi:MAG: DUF6666 family protein [Thermoguttaceae bacterium]
MNVTKLRLFGLVLGVSVCGTALAQSWQPARSSQSVQQSDDEASAVTQVDWQDRVLRRPQSLQWQSSQRGGTYQTARRSAYGDEVVMESSGSTVKSPAAKRQAPLATDAEVIPPGQAQPFEPIASAGPFADTGRGGRRCASCNGGATDGEMVEDGSSCDACNACEGPACGERCDFGWEVFDGCCGPLLRGISVFAGADAFKGPMDRGSNGDFGVNEGVNMARPLGDPWGCGYQIGANFVQSSFSSARNEETEYRDWPYRKQYFVTTGIFRNADPCGGLQWGVVYDYLHDIYYQNADLQQIRCDLGVAFCRGWETGFYGAFSINSDRYEVGRTVAGKLESTDMFTMYVGQKFENGGHGRVFGGATSNGDGLVGGNLWLPLGRGLALENRLTYLIPNGKITGQRDTVSQEREGWGLTMQLVWYPGQSAKCQPENPYRPMLGTADNSTFMVDRVTR